MSKLKTLGLIAAIIGALNVTNTPTLAEDMSNGANNFCKSNAVTVKKVTFKNQYNMQVVGNPLPKT